MIVKIREEKKLPVIMLSAKGEDTDKIIGLNMGADDYITKPFNPLELMARVKAQLRRYSSLGSLEINDSIYQSGGLLLDDQQKQVTVDDKPVKLTPIEYNILKLLISNRGMVFSSDQIYEKVWNELPVGSDNIVSVHIRHLREKIEANPKSPMYLKVVWGLGYKIDRVGK
nr:response regulator transcription factor [Candidatus Contubernalis alkalaceticus]